MDETDVEDPDAGGEQWVRDSLFALSGIYTPLGIGSCIFMVSGPVQIGTVMDIFQRR